jgi:peptidyl-prolyl cis-trans isomerase D
MLQNIRDNSQGWIAKTIIGLMVVLMALFGVDQIFQSTSNAQDAAEVNGEAISLNELAKAEDLQRRRLMQQLGGNFDESLIDEKLLREAALKGLIERQLLLQGTVAADFALSDAAIDQVMLQEPQFQVDGKFDPDRFDMVIRQMGYTRQQFRQMLREEMLIMQLRAGLAASSFVTDAEISNFVRLEKQRRDFATLTLKATTEGIDITDADIKTFYDEHASEFLSPEQVQLEYVELKKDGFFDQVEVTADELQSQYQKEIAGLAEQRQAAHILIEVNDQVSDEQARQKLSDIQQRLSTGEDFAVLAREFSADPGSANNGGDLGYAGPGVYDPAFEQALYALKQNEVSAPVRSAYGWHLIKLLGVQGADVPAFDSLKEKLTKDLKAEKVEQRFVEASKDLEDSSYESADLVQPAQEQGLEIKLSEVFGREGSKEGIASNRQVLQAAFSEELLENAANSQLIELDPDTVVVVRVKKHDKPEQLPLDTVSAAIRQELLMQRAAAASKEKGLKILSALREGKTLADEQVTDQTWTVVEAASRNQEGIAPEVLQELFRMPKPAIEGKPSFDGIATRNGDFILIRLNGVNEPQNAVSTEEQAEYRKFLSSRQGEQDFAAYRRQLQEKAEIERF